MKENLNNDRTDRTGHTDPARRAELLGIEKQLSEQINADIRRWTSVYTLLRRVDNEKLYLEKPAKSFNQWMNMLADSLGVHVSLLYARKQAGGFYEEYAERAAKRGKAVPNLNELAVAPDSLTLCGKIAGSDPAVMDHLIDQVLAGKLTREDLRQANRERRRSGGTVPKTRHEAKKISEERKANAERLFQERHGRDQDTDQGDRADNSDQRDNPAGLTEAAIILALRRNKAWIGKFDETEYRDRKYRVFPQFPVDTGATHSAQRADALVAETLTTSEKREVVLHMIEIKISAADLSGDEKMQNYTPFCDRFWLAIPDSPKMIAAAEEYRLDGWGLLAFSSDGEIRVVHNATLQQGGMRHKTLSTALIKLL